MRNDIAPLQKWPETLISGYELRFAVQDQANIRQKSH